MIEFLICLWISGSILLVLTREQNSFLTMITILLWPIMIPIVYLLLKKDVIKYE